MNQLPVGYDALVSDLKRGYLDFDQKMAAAEKFFSYTYINPADVASGLLKTAATMHNHDILCGALRAPEGSISLEMLCDAFTEAATKGVAVERYSESTARDRKPFYAVLAQALVSHPNYNYQMLADRLSGVDEDTISTTALDVLQAAGAMSAKSHLDRARERGSSPRGSEPFQR